MPGGRPKSIKTPEDLLNLFYEFRRYKKSQRISVPCVTKLGIGTLEHTPPLTWTGFDAWLFENDIIFDSRRYRDNKDGAYPEYCSVVRAINNILYTDKFEGAAVGAYNQNIIARDLGLTDHTDITTDGESIQVLLLNDRNQKV